MGGGGAPLFASHRGHIAATVVVVVVVAALRPEIVELFLFTLAPYDAHALVLVSAHFLPQVIELHALFDTLAAHLEAQSLP